MMDGPVNTAKREMTVPPMMPTNAPVVVSFFQYNARIIVGKLTVAAIENARPERYATFICFNASEQIMARIPIAIADIRAVLICP